MILVMSCGLFKFFHFGLSLFVFAFVKHYLVHLHNHIYCVESNVVLSYNYLISTVPVFMDPFLFLMLLCLKSFFLAELFFKK